MNAASAMQSSLAPGEIFSIFGQGVGTAADPSATKVFVNGVAAPLLYSSSGQVNAAVRSRNVGSSGRQCQYRRRALGQLGDAAGAGKSRNLHHRGDW